MLRDAADQLNAAPAARERVARSFPGESIEFVTAATLLDAQTIEPIGWSWRRFSQLRGTVVLTDRRAVMRSSTASPATVIWLGVLGWVVWRALDGEFTTLPFGVLAFLMLLQRRPYRRDFPWAELTSLAFGSTRGIPARGDILVLGTPSGAVHVVTAQLIPPELKEVLVARVPGARPAPVRPAAAVRLPTPPPLPAHGFETMSIGELERHVFSFAGDYFDFIGRREPEVVAFRSLVERRDAQRLRSEWRALADAFERLERQAGHSGRPLLADHYFEYERALAELCKRQRV